MGAVTIGPLVLAANRFSAILAILAFLVATSILARRLDPRIGSWSNWAILAGLGGARIAHVLVYWERFAEAPWRIFAIWQGGFHWVGGLVGMGLASLLLIRATKPAVGAACALAVSLLVWGVAHELTRVTLGQEAPTVTLPALDGPPMSIADARGKPAVVNLWATWCPPCRREMPLLAKMAAERDDITFLFVNQGETPDTIRTYLARQTLALRPVLLDRTMQVARYYGTIGYPVTLFLRADGTLATLHVGEISPEMLDEKIARIAAARRHTGS